MRSGEHEIRRFVKIQILIPKTKLSICSKKLHRRTKTAEKLNSTSKINLKTSFSPNVDLKFDN